MNAPTWDRDLAVLVSGEDARVLSAFTHRVDVGFRVRTSCGQIGVIWTQRHLDVKGACNMTRVEYD